MNEINFRSIFMAGVLQKLVEDPGLFRRQLSHAVSGGFWELPLASKLIRPGNYLGKDEVAQEVPSLELGEYREFLDHINHSSNIKKLSQWRKIARALRLKEGLSGQIHSVTASSKSDGSGIVFFLNNAAPYTNSGYTVRTSRIVSALSQAGLKISLVTRLGYPAIIGKRPKAESEDNLIKLLPKKLPYGARRRREVATGLLVAEARRIKPAVLHTTTGSENAQIVSKAADILGLPWVYEMRGQPHNTWLSELPRAIQERARRSSLYKDACAKETESALQANAVVVLSQLAKTELVEQGVPEEKIFVIPNAVSNSNKTFTVEAAHIRKELQMGENGLLIGVISALVKYEGIDTAIKAMKELPEAYKLVIVGHGEDSARLRDLADQLNLNSRVIFAGAQPPDDVEKWYASLDVFLTPRTDELVCRNVTPIKPLQALALGVPVVCSNLPALREVTGGYAVFTEPEDPVALAQGIEQAARSPDDYRAPREWLNSRSWDANVETLKAMYEQLMNETGKGLE